MKVFREMFRLFSDLYLFSEPNNYCFDRAAPAQLEKYCNWVENTGKMS